MEEWKMIDPIPGDHIRVESNGYYHHGIYIGNNEVIQFGLPFDMFRNHKDIKIIKSPIEDFLNNGFLEVRIYSKKEQKRKNSNEEIIRIAHSMLGQGDYNILYNNCEHFANYCVFGVKSSSQVDDVHLQIKNLLNKK
jgi:hypothetical protein